MKILARTKPKSKLKPRAKVYGSNGPMVQRSTPTSPQVTYAVCVAWSGVFDCFEMGVCLGGVINKKLSAYVSCMRSC